MGRSLLTRLEDGRCRVAGVHRISASAVAHPAAYLEVETDLRIA